MQTIMLMNAKGGSGKSTIASNLAGFQAVQGKKVVLVDLDHQGSTLDWAEARPPHAANINIIGPTKSVRVSSDTDFVVFDAPGAVHGRAIDRMVKRVDTLLIPVSPSPVDIRATARFIEELLLVRRISRDKTRFGVIANRVRATSPNFESLTRFLDHLHIPLVATISDHDNYMRASGLGLSIFELEGTEEQRAEWEPLIRWLTGAPGQADMELLRSLGDFGIQPA